MKSVLKKVITALIVAGIYFGWALLFSRDPSLSKDYHSKLKGLVFLVSEG